MKKNVIATKGLWIVGLLLLFGVTVAAYGLGRAGERADCPGKVICPLTGDEVCKDQCPLADANRSDCPGKVECPLSGELVCKDQCPLAEANRSDCPGKVECSLSGEPVCRDECPLDADAKTAKADDQLPPCCRGEK